ncbi:MAG: PLP-dependent transferase [Clostridia bacterium]|nr:PLP-dependent transferase [Clostridia bacterium]
MIDKNHKQFGRKMDSVVVHGYQGCDPLTGAISFPIYQTSTYKNPGLNSNIKFSYSRCDNPTRAELEDTVALLENGVAGFAFTSGLAAVTATFSLLKSGEHVIISDDIYGGTYRQVENIWKELGVEFDYVDVGDIAAIKAAVKPNTKMIYLESPTNPMMKVADIAAISQIAKECGALSVVDNTFLTPYFQKPLDLGADIVIHSGTKFLAGHHDTTAGFVVVNSEALAEKISFMVRTEGAGLSPFDSWLLLRGIKTLALRMRKHEENALKVAEFLKDNPSVEKVYFVGLPEHPSYDVSKKQTTGFGGMISFTIKDVSKVEQVLCGGDMIMFAESLGGTATLITYPQTQTHASIPAEIRNKIGITDRLIRLSVGIEDAEDIIADLEKMLK